MDNVLKVLNKIDHVIEIIQKIFVSIGVALMVVINGAQVFCRFVIHSSIPWSEQVSVMLFFILIMVGGNFAMRTDTETRIELLKFKNKRSNYILKSVIDLICLFTLVIFLICSISLEKQTIQFPQYLSSIHLNYVYIYVWLIIGFLLMIFDKLINLLKNINHVRNDAAAEVVVEEE